MHSGWVISYQERYPGSSFVVAGIEVHSVYAILVKNRALVAAVGAGIEVHSGRAISYQEQSPGSSCVGAGSWSAQRLSNILPRTESW